MEGVWYVQIWTSEFYILERGNSDKLTEFEMEGRQMLLDGL